MPKNLNENIIIRPSKYQYRHCQVLSIIKKKKVSLNNFLNMIAHMFQCMKIKLVSLGMMDRDADAILDLELEHIKLQPWNLSSTKFLHRK